jgi:alpha-N-arabinofuranosidase
VSNEWKRFAGHLQVNADSPAAAGYRLALLADSPGQFVIQRLLLRPEDHVDGADPDVVRLLRESHLPLLRWPGGNFVSAYHWQDGVGTVEHRPTLANYAWGGVEPNLFGTDEFVAFCRAVECEPMICINAGTGTPEEAARWVEYCNGSPSSPMGRLRAANGSGTPFRVKYWEVGNELWGRWQANWTTAGGYVDRYRLFARAMRAADPTITPYACGAPALWSREWNQTLITALGKDMPAITDHPLIGGTVSASADPMDVYRDFMDVPEVLQTRWQQLRESLAMAGVSSPRLAITELQVFAKAGNRVGTEPEHLTASNLVNQASQGEALYDILVYHAALRLAPFVELVTHSAVVNHGGGLRKQHERVYSNPCHYAQGAFTALAGATLVPVEIECTQERAPLVLPDLQHAVPEASYGAVDAVAATKDGSLWLSIVHRGTAGPIDLAVMLEDTAATGQAEVLTLSADAPWEKNTLEEPERIKPAVSSIPCRQGRLELHLRPFSFTRVRLALPK